MRRIKLVRIQKDTGKKAKRRLYAGHLDEFSLVDSPAVGEKVLVAKRASGTTHEGGDEMSKAKDVKKDAGEETAEVTDTTDVEATTDESTGADDKIDRLIEAVNKNTETVAKYIKTVETKVEGDKEEVSKSTDGEAETKKDDAPAAEATSGSGADVAVFVSTVTKTLDEKLGPVAETLEKLEKRVGDIEEARPAPTGGDAEETEQVEKSDKPFPFWGGLVTGVRG